MWERQQRFYHRLMVWGVGWTYWLICQTYLRLMLRTTVGETYYRSIDAQPRKGIMVPWHCCIPYGWWMTRNRNGAIMISLSNFGAVAAAITKRLGCIPVRGGSRFGGKEALDKIVDYVKRGHWALIVADGPRGPAHVCKHGPILAAQRTGRPLIPVSFSARWKWRLNTWDRTMIPKPFSPLLWMYGEPFYVPKDLDQEGLEDKRQEFEKILMKNHEMAQDYWNTDRTRKNRPLAQSS